MRSRRRLPSPKRRVDLDDHLSPARGGPAVSRKALLLAGACITLLAAAAGQFGGPVAGASVSPIQHVVILYQENHSFDNVLGELCVEDVRCDGATTGVVDTGQTIPLTRSPDITPESPHGYQAEKLAIDGGKMDGFSKYGKCAKSKGYPCYSQFYPDQIPNLAALARAFVISDRTFELRPE